MSNIERSFSSHLRELRLNNRFLDNGEHLSPAEKDFYFAMACNGFFQTADNKWVYLEQALQPLVEEFKGQRVAFFGPNTSDLNFFSGGNKGCFVAVEAFKQEAVAATIAKYREIDDYQAARIIYILGGIARYHSNTQFSNTNKAINFVARMTRMGDNGSADAIASVVARYVISNGSLAEDPIFTGDIYFMAEAVSEDPIRATETKYLGLSQLARLRAYHHKRRKEAYKPLPDITQYEPAFEGFPTVGAEFHFSPYKTVQFPRFWQRLAILNMSQYQRGSYIQLSRNDRGVVEIRMNPSVYPVTIANWQHITRHLPELEEAFFTITLNRSGPSNDFYWQNSNDKTILDNLRYIGMLSYATNFEDVPTAPRDEINLGSVYLGQTVRVANGEYNFTGYWGGGDGQNGQIGIFAGFGKNFPELAYYLSMGLAKPSILRAIPTITTLQSALELGKYRRQDIFRAIRYGIATDERLNHASQDGFRVMNLLAPSTDYQS